MQTDIIRVLEKRGFRITESRMRVIRAICLAGGFIANVEIFWLGLRAVQPISRATVYNTVRLMVQSGILQGEYQEHRFTSYRFAAGKKWKITGGYSRNTLQNAMV